MSELTAESKIRAKCNLDTGVWTVDDTSLLGNISVNLEIGFTDDTPSDDIMFKNLRFGFDISSNGERISQKVFPRDNHYYVSSDQEYLHSETFMVQTNQQYDLMLWCENNGSFSKVDVQFTGPKPQKPYESWLWDETDLCWKAPIPEPEMNKEEQILYAWSESEQKWIDIINENLEKIIGEAAAGAFQTTIEEPVEEYTGPILTE